MEDNIFEMCYLLFTRSCVIYSIYMCIYDDNNGEEV
jgi:hypothetical protein